MGIGTSKGAFYEDQFHYAQSQWDPKYDDNEVTPEKQRTDKQLDGAELDPMTGLGIEISNQEDFIPSPNIEDRRDEVRPLRTYQEILNDNERAGKYSESDNKLLDRDYTDLEKKAGMLDLDKTELDTLVNLIRKGMAMKDLSK